MPIEFIAGDVFVNRMKAKALAHGCNCQGGFKERYPEMYAEYRQRCKADPRQFNLGDVFLWRAEDQPWVFNLGTQERYWRARASYEAIETALAQMKDIADNEGIESIAMPQVGTGYGGLSWRKIRVIIEQVFEGWRGTLYVYEEYVPGE